MTATRRPAVAPEASPVTQPRPLPRTPGTALYQGVGLDLARRVAEREFSPEAKLPPEAELAKSYGVNRLTVRRALAELVRAGTLRTEHGVGTFVQIPAVRHRVDDGRASLYESLAARGLSVVHHVIDVTRLPARRDHARFPRWPGPAVRFRYRRTVDGVPWSLSQATLPRELAPQDWDGDGSLFATLTQRSGIAVHRTERCFSATAANTEDAQWLDVPVGAPLLVVSGTNTDADGDALAYLEHRTRADRAEYAVTLPT